MPESIPDLVRCPACGAGNPAGATWCGQCLRRFGDERASEEGQPYAPSRPEPRPEPPLVRAREAGVQVWTCPACDAENPLEADACARCGSAFTSFFSGAPDRVPPRASAGASIALSAALPGLGHWIHRQAANAAARGLLYVWSVGIAILLLVRPPAAGGGIIRAVGVFFALSAAGVWLLSLLETMRLAEGDRRPLVPPRSLTWFAAALSSVLFLGLLGAAIAGR